MKCENKIDGNCIETLDKCKGCDPPAKSVNYDPYLPSCGTEMMQFYSDFCDKCQNPEETAWVTNQEGSGCPLIIQATAMNEQPEPWVIKDGKAYCLNFRS